LPSSKEMTLVEGSSARADTATSGTDVHFHIGLTGLLCSLKVAETEKASVTTCRAGAGGEAGGRESGRRSLNRACQQQQQQQQRRACAGQCHMQAALPGLPACP
jgi:hypothetical protein